MVRVCPTPGVKLNRPVPVTANPLNMRLSAHAELANAKQPSMTITAKNFGALCVRFMYPLPSQPEQMELDSYTVVLIALAGAFKFVLFEKKGARVPFWEIGC